jgi:hypothetical protein
MDGRSTEAGRASSATGYLQKEEMAGFVFASESRGKEMEAPTKEGWSANTDSEAAHSAVGGDGGAPRLRCGDLSELYRTLDGSCSSPSW